MVSKRKTRKVAKVVSEQPKVDKKKVEPKKIVVEDKLTPEQLIEANGTMAETLLTSLEWLTIGQPVLNERVVSVSGRFINGRWQHGSLTRLDNLDLKFQQGYAKGLMDFSNDLVDFVNAKKKVEEARKNEIIAKQQPMVGPLDEEE